MSDSSAGSVSKLIGAANDEVLKGVIGIMYHSEPVQIVLIENVCRGELAFALLLSLGLVLVLLVKPLYESLVVRLSTREDNVHLAGQEG